ncbi:MAG: hypothetical protein R3Y59_02995 [bacterium]
MKKFIFNLLIVGLITTLFASCESSGTSGTDEDSNGIVNLAWVDNDNYLTIEIITNDVLFFTFMSSDYSIYTYVNNYTYNESTKTITMYYYEEVWYTLTINDDGDLVINELTSSTTGESLVVPASTSLTADGDANAVKGTSWYNATYDYTVEFLTNRYINMFSNGGEYTYTESTGIVSITTYSLTGTISGDELSIGGLTSDGSNMIFTKQ